MRGTAQDGVGTRAQNDMSGWGQTAPTAAGTTV